MIILRLRFRTDPGIKFIENGNICSEVFNVTNEDFLKNLYYKNTNYHFRDWKKYRAIVKIQNDILPKITMLEMELSKSIWEIPYE